jgi:hypothetical protein
MKDSGGRRQEPRQHPSSRLQPAYNPQTLPLSGSLTRYRAPARAVEDGAPPPPLACRLNRGADSPAGLTAAVRPLDGDRPSIPRILNSLGFVPTLETRTTP